MAKRKGSRMILIIIILAIAMRITNTSKEEISLQPNWSFYSYFFKVNITFPDVLTEESCKEILKTYQLDIDNLSFVEGSSRNLYFKQIWFNITGLFPTGRRAITFTYTKNQGVVKFKGCNILDIYEVKKIETPYEFKQYFGCKSTDCKEVKGINGRFFYIYRKIKGYYELKYLWIHSTPQGEASIYIQALYMNEPLDKRIQFREKDVQGKIIRPQSCLTAASTTPWSTAAR